MNVLRKTPLQGVGSRGRDLDRDAATHELRGPVEMHDPEVRRASGHTAGPVDRLDENLAGPADERLMAPQLALLLPFVQRLEPALLLPLGDVVRQAGGGRARARRV